MDIEVKRLDSLARNRANAELKRRHAEEWQEIKDRLLANLKAELILTGSVDRERNPVAHVAGKDGTCPECGETSPCYQERKRAREARARKENPA